MDENFGMHLVIDGTCANSKSLHSIEKVYDFLDNIPAKIDMHKISRPSVIKYYDGVVQNEGGISGVVIIAESHISCHTFGDKKYILIDIFSCKDFDVEKTTKEVVEYWELEQYDVKVIERGEGFKHDKIELEVR